MHEQYDQIRFLAANYSKLQGLRAVPIGILAVFVTIWARYNQGPTADLSMPILVATSAALLYWLTDRYYNNVFGRINQTSRQRKRDIILSAGGSLLALLAFILDTTEVLPISTLGLVLAASFFEYALRGNQFQWKRLFTLFPENTVAAVFIVFISLLPLFGVSWWGSLGIKSQLVGVFLIFGIIIILTGIYGHWRMVRTLSTLKMKQANNAQGG